MYRGYWLKPEFENKRFQGLFYDFNLETKRHGKIEYFYLFIVFSSDTPASFIAPSG